MTFTQGLILLGLAVLLIPIMTGVAVRVGARAWFEEKWMRLRKEVPDLSTSDQTIYNPKEKDKGVH